ncbi:MAG: MMPL family transporter [Bacteroidales bacterium]|nr:MMPL family transporter [Bacteroidales bacterium]
MKISEFIYRFRWPIVIISWLISIGFALAIPKIEIDPDVKALIPKSMPSKINTEKIEAVFGGSEMLLVIFSGEDVLSPSILERLQNISNSFSKLPQIDRSLSLFSLKSIKGIEGNMVVSEALPFIPHTPEEREIIRKELSENELVMGVVVSDDFRLTAIIGTVHTGTDDKILLDSVNAIISRYPGEGEINLGGMPVVKQSITDNILKDVKILMPLSIFLMLLILTLSFRNYKGVVLPLSVVILSMLVSVGLIPLFGWKFALVTVLVPVMMIAIGNNYGIYLVTRYQEILKREPGISRSGLMAELSAALSRPILLCALTTIAGVLALLTHIIVPAREVGVLSAIGISWALILSLTYIPAMLGILPRSKPSFKENKPHETPLEHFLFRLGISISRKPKTTLLITALVTLVIGMGLAKIYVEGNTIKFFDSKDPVRTTSDLIDKNLGGSQTISIQFTGDIKNPVIMKRMLYYEESIKKQKGVGQVMSIASVVKLISKALLDPSDPGYNSIPQTRDGVAQFLELYGMSGDPSDYEQLVDFNYENAQLIIQVNDASSLNVLNLAKYIRKLTADDPAIVRIGGIGLISAEMTNSLVTGQWRSTIISMLIVCFLAGLIFRKKAAAFIVAVPLVMACLVLFGIMGWSGIPFDPATTLITSVMIGCGVDYTVQFLWRQREEMVAGLSPARAVVKTLYTTGKAICFNAFAVMIGFSPLVFSSFSPIRFFGIMMVVSIFACLIGALIVIPALTLILSPTFLTGNQPQISKNNESI